MAKEHKAARIISRVIAEDRAWIDQEAEPHRLDPSSFITMTLRRIRNATEASAEVQAA